MDERKRNILKLFVSQSSRLCSVAVSMKWNCKSGSDGDRELWWQIAWGAPQEEHTHSPCAAASLVALLGLDSLAGPLPSAAAPSVSGELRISLEVMDDMPVTAQPAQPDEAADGWAEDATSFSEG